MEKTEGWEIGDTHLPTELSNTPLHAAKLISIAIETLDDDATKKAVLMALINVGRRGLLVDADDFATRTIGAVRVPDELGD